MNMQAFYQRLAEKPTRARQRRLLNLTYVTRAQVVDATNQVTWLIWGADMSVT